MRPKAQVLPLPGPSLVSCLDWGWPALSNEGAETRNGLAKDQILDLKRAFVGVERFAVRKEARDLVVGDDPVAAKQLAGPCNGLAALGGTERLGERRMRVRQFAF